MKPKRVDCTYCSHFVKDVLEDENNWFSKVKEKAKCNIGKRIMFRFDRKKAIDFTKVGYIRYCERYELNEKMYKIDKR